MKSTNPNKKVDENLRFKRLDTEVGAEAVKATGSSDLALRAGIN